MNDTGKEVAIDIGGGYGEYFVERARKEPGKIFIILEPNPPRILRKPANLQILGWQSDSWHAIPLASGSVDEANINFLFGEIDTNERADASVEEAADKYERILQDLRPVLKEGGLVRIVDSKEYILKIKELLKKEGYVISQNPTVLADTDRTVWSQRFYDVFKKVGKPPEESSILPMTIEARK